MKILVSNRGLANPGGSETYLYSVIEELLSLGHEVHSLCKLKPGLVAEKLKNLSVPVYNKPIKDNFDLILSSHNCTIDLMDGVNGFKIQTCHGIYPEPEQPSKKVNFHVSISEEVKTHLNEKGFESEVIYNGVNCEKFKPIKPINNKLKTVLSLAQSDLANEIIKKSCDLIGVELIELNKFKSWEWNVNEYIQDADLVVSLGRGCYESMASGRNVVIFDHRNYGQKSSIGDGFVNTENVKLFLKNNCSGRYSNQIYDHKMLSEEFLKYDPLVGQDLRNFALSELNIKNQIKKYFNLIR